MRLNLEKCNFGVWVDKFLGFYLTGRGIEPNLDKCKSLIRVEEPTTKKKVMGLNGMLEALNKFISKSS